jgi:hypothetical protein
LLNEAGAESQTYLAKIFRLFREVFVRAVREPPLQQPPGIGVGIGKIHPDTTPAAVSLQLSAKIRALHISSCLQGILYQVRFVGAGFKPAPTSDINGLSE